MASDTSTIDLPHRPYSITAGFLSYLVPGLGQIYQGRTFKGVLFLVCLWSLFFAGNAMGDWRNVYLPDPAAFPETIVGRWKLNGPVKAVFYRWQFLGQFWIGSAAWPALYQYSTFDPDKPNPILHNFQRFPSDENKLNEELTNSDKTPDVAWVYTVIAGVLNILVIYDAYAGPAYLLPNREQRDKPQGEAAA